MSPRATADVEDPGAGLQPELRHEVIDLLHRALRVGVPVVGRPEVIGQVLEPVVARRAPPV